MLFNEKAMLIYDKGLGEYKNWILCEKHFDSRYQGKCESTMALGNGYLGVRAALEESYIGQTRNLFVAGTFNRFHPDEVTELPNVADVTEFQIYLNSELFSLDMGEVLEYNRYLNIKEAELVREVLWQSPKNETFKLEFRRFVSLDDLHTIAFKLKIVPLTCDAAVKIKTGIDGRMTNSGSQHFREGDKQVYDKKYMQLVQTTTESDIDFVLNTSCQGNGSFETEFGVERRRIYGIYEFQAQKDIGIVFEKISNIFTSRDKQYIMDYNIKSLKEDSHKHLQHVSLMGYDGLFLKSKEKWSAYWRDVEIDLVSKNQEDILAIRFAQYHLLIMTPMHDGRFNIGAKGLSGEGYKGHVFWDTEIFMLPYFQYNMPDVARQLLLYRYNNLEGARNKALKFGYKGAMFPWETAFSGEEETPEWAALNIMTGKPTRVWAGLKEHHVTADIAYTVWQYYLSTHDFEFMERYGYEMIFECAWFWCSRLSWNSMLERFEITDVIGPDEYTEHIDNNAYTNYMAHYVISLAVQLYEKLNCENKAQFDKLESLLNLNERYETYKLAIDKLYLPVAEVEGILPQDDTFLGKKEIDIKQYRVNNLKQSILLDYSRNQVVDFQVLKQADVIMLFHTLRKQFDLKTIEKSWQYYEPRTIHDSSLSHAVHGMVAATINDIKAAYGFFKEASMIDMGSNPISSNSGVHGASMGGIWMMVTLGFGGVFNNEGNLELNPLLPDEWSRLKFSISWQGKKLHIDITQISIVISTDSQEDFNISVYGIRYMFKEKLIIKHEV
jgi:hypothetical glycosyl hydrolase